MQITATFTTAANQPMSGWIAARAPRQIIGGRIVEGSVWVELDQTGTGVLHLVDGLQGVEVRDELEQLQPSPWVPFTGDEWPTGHRGRCVAL